MAQSGGGKGWSTDPETGEQTMPARWASFLDWMLLGVDRVPATQKEWTAANGVHEDSVRRWKRDPRFIREWDRRAAELNVHPERTQRVIEALFGQAAQGDVKAASLYLQYIDKFTPKRRVVVDDDRDAAGLSNEELASALEAEVRHLRMVHSG